ncbi:hypothetical protein ZWY2020_009158 [Hordeum vulgare]|nr:hypothetical protein ZWY2020_009158 [Hordeum vulgare]
MDMVIACGANEGSDEHFIATELFVKRDQREMFLHMNVASGLGWLRRKYDNKCHLTVTVMMATTMK